MKLAAHRMHTRSILVLLAMVLTVQGTFSQKAYYLDEIKKAVEKGWRDNPRIVQEWRKTSKPSVLWGYDAPGNPVYLAGAMAFLYQETHQREYAERAANLLATYGDFRDVLPKGYAATRAEYADGVPALSNFFYMPAYVKAYLGIRNSGVLNARTREKIERELSQSIDFIFRFPEWGAHNRAMLRAESLMDAYLAMPSNPHAPRWKKMAEVIAGDNLEHWEIEDASNYNPVWLLALFSYADAAGRDDVFTSPEIQYYLKYYVKLIAPSGTIPDFGDAFWNSSAGALRFVAIFEKGAAVYKSPEMKWAAQSVLRTLTSRTDTVGVGDAFSLAEAYQWTDESIPAKRPTSLSGEVLDDVIGKKVVFRNGWADSSLYCLLNYRDEGDGGWLDREYLRRTISVEEEKMTHGHSDENSIVLLMNKGSVLLHDAGYRSGLPSGPFGAWRQDFFHNRLVVRLNKRDSHQGVLAFVENSGAYRAVRTNKVDFVSLRDVDMSRTRVTDEVLGYQWDRSVTYVREPGFFVVVDGVKFLRSDYFTLTNFWHAQNIFLRGDRFFDVATDSVPGYHFSPHQSLLIKFLDSPAKEAGSEPISRHSQMEHAMYETISSQYKAGDMETFVTVLYPHNRGLDPAAPAGMFALMETSVPSRTVGVQFDSPKGKSYICVNLDLDRELARENIRPRYVYDLGKARYGDFETDAYYLFARLEADSLEYSVTNFVKLFFRGKPVIEALPNTFGLQLDGGAERVSYAKWRTWEDTIEVK